MIEFRVGFMFERDRAPEDLPASAAALEEMGADDIWVIEDLGWTGAISSAALALAATSRLRVGIGIAPVALRNPALLAMEVANLARVHPGRLVAGVGHGAAGLMRMVGADRPGKMALLEESIAVLRGLVSGEEVTLRGREVTVEGVKLVHPAHVVPPIVTGVVKPRSLELSGRVADGTVLAEGAGPAEITAALGHIETGRRSGDRPEHELIVFTYLHVSDDPERAAAVTGDMVAAQAGWLGVAPEEVFSVIGPAADIPAKVAALRAAGASTVVLRPLGDDPDGQARLALEAIRTTSSGK